VRGSLTKRNVEDVDVQRNRSAPKGTTRRDQPPRGWAVYYRVVARIPRGRVATYGQVALLAGTPRAARQVGYALAALRGTRHRIPWQRVLGARSRGLAAISILDPMGSAVQQALLEREGVEVDARGRVSLERFGWRPRRRAPRR
jgi:methylated-DNA-protein-cysteine methyltransferase-like protein